MQTQHNVLGYMVELYFHDYKVVIEIDQNGHSNRNIDYQIDLNKSLVVSLLELILTKKTLIFLELLVKYLDTLSNRLFSVAGISNSGDLKIT